MNTWFEIDNWIMNLMLKKMGNFKISTIYMRSHKTNRKKIDSQFSNKLFMHSYNLNFQDNKN
jgi:hypothetical protein